MLNDYIPLMLGITALTTLTNTTYTGNSFSKEQILDTLDEQDLTLASKEIRRQLNDEET